MKYICIIYIILLLQACGDSKKNNQRTTKNNHTVAIENNNGAYLKIDRNRHNFGKVQKSKTPIIPIKFKIENLGTVPLVILKVDVEIGRASCRERVYVLV